MNREDRACAEAVPRAARADVTRYATAGAPGKDGNMTEQQQPSTPTTPSPQEPLGYDMPFPPGRPASVTVLAIIGIIIGGFLSLCTPFSLIFFFVDLGVPNPMFDAIKQDDALFAWSLFSTVVQWGLGIL